VEHLPLILGMTLVTYVPRLLPLVSFSGDVLPPVARRFLRYLPACALGALLVPGVWEAIPRMPVAAVAGTAVAAGVALLRRGLVLPVAAGVLVTYILLLL
jgi:branched-subunit amino acid transport protein